MIWCLALEKKPFQFWREICIQVVVILLQLYIHLIFHKIIKQFANSKGNQKSLWTHCVVWSVPTWGNRICGNLEMMPVSTRTSQMFGVEWMKPLKTAFSTQPLLEPRSGSAFLTLLQITLVTPRFHLKKNNKKIPYLCRHSRTASQYCQSQSEWKQKLCERYSCSIKIVSTYHLRGQEWAWIKISFWDQNLLSKCTYKC